jgi:dienelactone hydrolase
MRHRRSPISPLLLLIAAVAAGGAAAPASAEVVRERVSYEFQGDPFYGWLVHDDSLPTPRPGILLFHEWWGLDDFALEQATALAELGYVVFCADMYGMNPSGDNIVAESPQEAQRLSGRLYRDRVWMRQLATTAFLLMAKQPQVDPSRVATLGFGFGGTVAVELARSGAAIDGTICFHGGLFNPNPSDAGRIKGEMLVLQGTKDPMVGDAEIDAFEAEMDAANRPYEIIRLSGAEHAFSNRRSDFWNIPGASYDQRAAERASEHVAAFLQRTLGGPTQGRARISDE